MNGLAKTGLGITILGALLILASLTMDPGSNAMAAFIFGILALIIGAIALIVGIATRSAQAGKRDAR